MQSFALNTSKKLSGIFLTMMPVISKIIDTITNIVMGRINEEDRIRDLKAKCEKKGLKFEEEEAKYRAELALRNEKARLKEALKTADKKDKAALDERLPAILDRRGAKCTFNLNSGMRVPGPVANFFLGSRKMISLDDMAAMSWEYGVFRNWQRLEQLLEMLSGAADANFATNREVIERCEK